VTRTHLWLMLAILIAGGPAAPARAQAPQAAVSEKTGVTPLKVTVTISRYQGEKRVSNLPYALSVNLLPGEHGTASLRMGSKIPITSTTTQNGASTTTYTDVGTQIDCSVYAPDESGRFRLNVSVEESSVYEDPSNKGTARSGLPNLQTFQTRDSLMIKDGQSLQLSNTPDRVTGEIVRVDVALAVVK